MKYSLQKKNKNKTFPVHINSVDVDMHGASNIRFRDNVKI